jgi:hypothetical protein
MHQDSGYLAGNAGRHEGHVAIDVSVIGGDRVQRRFHRGDQEISAGRQAGHSPRPQQPFSPGVRWRPSRRGQRGRSGIGCRVRGLVVQMGNSIGWWRR